MPTFTTNYNLPKPNVNSPDDEDLWGDQLNDGMDIIDEQLKQNADDIAGFQGTPTGAVIDFAGTAAPSGYLFCFGQEVSRTTYAALFTAIGATFGAGDGSTTFLLPDLRGRVTAGKDDMGGTSANRLTDQSGGLDGDTLGDTGGAETHTLTESELASHNHDLVSTQGQSSRATSVGPDAFWVPFTAGSSQTIDDAGGDSPHNNVQPTIVLNKIIKT